MEAAYGATQAHLTLDVNDNRDPPTSRSAPHVDKKLSNTSRNNDKYRAEPLGLSESTNHLARSTRSVSTTQSTTAAADPHLGADDRHLGVLDAAADVEGPLDALRRRLGRRIDLVFRLGNSAVCSGRAGSGSVFFVVLGGGSGGCGGGRGGACGRRVFLLRCCRLS